MIFAIYGLAPFMAQVTRVVSPLGSMVNSTMLLPLNGRKKSSLMTTLFGGEVSAISMRPEPTWLLPSQS